MLLNMIATALQKLARVVRPTSSSSLDPDQRGIARQQKLLVMHRSLLAEYLRQQQQWERMEVPDFLRFGIRTMRSRIVKVKGTLRSWGVEVSDLPDDEGPDNDIGSDVQHQRELLSIYRRNLATYLRQRHPFPAGQVPATIVNAIEDTQRQIQHIKGILRGFGVAVDDLPEEEAE